MAQNKNGPIIGLAIFSVLSVVFAVFWYLTYSDNTAKTQALVNAGNKEQELTRVVNEQLAEANSLKDAIGVEHSLEIGAPGENASVLGTVDAIMKRVGGDGTGAPDNLVKAVNNLASESNKNMWKADNRKQLADDAAVAHQAAIATKDAEIAQFKAAAAKAESELVQQETAHSEEMERLETQLADLSKAKAQLELDLAKTRDDARREKEDLEDIIAQNRIGLVALRSRLRAKEDPSFSRPDGVITNVDHTAQLCYLDLGAADGLRTGVTFSVYKQNNSGVGRANTSDIKGSIEVTEILGKRRAKASLVWQKDGDPINANDPIYSPVFSAGESLEVVIAGQIRVKGLDRNELRRRIQSAGAKVSVEISDDGEFTDGRGEPLTEDEARRRVTSRTRYLVIGDLGDPNKSSDDIGQQQQYEQIRKKTEVLKAESENLGIYPIGLSSFLEHIGYSRPHVAWTPENGQPFPGHSSGSAGRSANATLGNRESGSSISGRYSGRKNSSLTSGGTTSGAYSN